jgi:Methyltransferase domain
MHNELVECGCLDILDFVAKLFAQKKWLARLAGALDDGSFVKLTLGGPAARGDTLKNVFVRPVELKAGPRLSFVYRYAARDVTKNHPADEGLALIEKLIGEHFRHAHLFTTQAILELRFRDGEDALIIASKPANQTPSSAAHDQPKQRLIDPHAGWLHTLGVTTVNGNVAKGMEAKFRQINKFVEVLWHLLEHAGIRRSAKDQLMIVDMGCGKGYLTFAAYEWLRRSGWNEATLRGIEARPDLVDLCNHAAKENHFDLLRFETGTIAAVEPARADVLIALHACDTATDDAIAWGVRARASLIIVSPCCHKELRPQLRPPPALAGALRHGILLERQAEFVTDALRAALLEWAGYETKVFEFISTEHTAKNLMIAAIKRPVGPVSSLAPRLPAPDPNAGEFAAKVRELAALYDIRTQRLASNLGFSLAAGE